jgi:cyclophilin family peptidyl-prolyl cis-trans isomerase
VQNLWKSIQWLALVPILALAGCQKGDTPPPTAAVPAADVGNPQPIPDAGGENSHAASDADFLHPVYEFDTSHGKFSVRLDKDKAPLTVDNFHDYVARGHYDGTIFHGVVKEPVQIVLGGVYTADLKEKKPQTPIRNEADNGLKNRRGTIAMVHADNYEDSATCQFFINLADNDILNYKSRTPKGYGYCVFGEVTDGMEVVDKIAKSPVHDTDKFRGLPVESVIIRAVRQIK